MSDYADECQREWDKLESEQVDESGISPAERLEAAQIARQDFEISASINHCSLLNEKAI